MEIVIYDAHQQWENLLPITYTRPAGLVVNGILCNAERWSKRLGLPFRTRCAVPYLAALYDVRYGEADSAQVFVNGDFSGHDIDPQCVLSLSPGQTLCDAEGTTIAHRCTDPTDIGKNTINLDYTPMRIGHVYDLFLQADTLIRADYDMLTQGRVSQSPDEYTRVIGDPTQLFIEEGAHITASTINVSTGPIYVGRDASITEGSCLRGPVSIGHGATVNMGAKIYPATVVGAHCKVGGELNNVVMQPYSNKSHDGFLGNAVIGSWCNIGAGCTASNLKNDYTPIKLWNYPAQRFLRTPLQFCGVIMGDHTKCGINTMLNTATVLGVGVNIHGSGFPRAFVASFSDGGPTGYTDVSLDKFFDIAQRMMARRGLQLTEAHCEMFRQIKTIAEQYREI